MSDNRTIQLLEVPIGGQEGTVWNCLHQEREDICEALVKTSGPGSAVYRELLQSRLRKIDDALDRLMSRLDRFPENWNQPLPATKAVQPHMS